VNKFWTNGFKIGEVCYVMVRRFCKRKKGFLNLGMLFGKCESPGFTH